MQRLFILFFFIGLTPVLKGQTLQEIQLSYQTWDIKANDDLNRYFSDYFYDNTQPDLGHFQFISASQPKTREINFQSRFQFESLNAIPIGNSNSALNISYQLGLRWIQQNYQSTMLYTRNERGDSLVYVRHKQFSEGLVFVSFGLMASVHFSSAFSAFVSVDNSFGSLRIDTQKTEVDVLINTHPSPPQPDPYANRTGSSFHMLGTTIQSLNAGFSLSVLSSAVGSFYISGAVGYSFVHEVFDYRNKAFNASFGIGLRTGDLTFD